MSDVDPATDYLRSQPDYVVYVPRGEAFHDTDNEHFLVFPLPSGALRAWWTQSSCEGRGDNRVMTSRSADDGRTWSTPRMVVGCPPGEKGNQASWGLPVHSRAGRIYVLYTKQGEFDDGNPQGCGTMGCVYSDDEGETWQPGVDLPMPRDEYDNADPRVPRNWIIWQPAIRDSQGRQFVGYTQNNSRSRMDPGLPWYQWEQRCRFLRFENVDDGPDPADLRVTWLEAGPRGLTVPHPVTGGDAASEPSPVLLPDGRLFCVMRTWTGHIWYSVSDDDGETWREVEVLRYHDGGPVVEHPLAPCPIYRLSDGRYILIFHNNTGCRDGHDIREAKWPCNHLDYVRDPAWLSVGKYMPTAHQPLWFSRPQVLLETNGVHLGPKGTAEIATYTSVTEHHGKRVLWYPDRKYYLLGIDLTEERLGGFEWER